MNLKYRPEIDGLRAIAVLPVILFHAGFSSFSGGFVGVDVFFVISGYLITSIIVKDVEAGRFSFWEFYERRARRILPALFLVMLCCIPIAWMWMMPMELKAFATSVISVCLFASNFLFWRQSGYFDTAAELKPLLHTWSLAVEEQYYIIFPLAILLLWRLGRRNVIGSIALVAVLSLALSEYGSRFFPSANFYLLPTRAWELMAGALCSFAIAKRNIPRDNVISLAGLIAIVASVFVYDETIPFPSFYALVPVLGTCAVLLFARQGTLSGSLLSLRPLVGIGLISYSAYLWHQPLFAFARIRSLTEPSWQLMLLLAFASLGPAYLSWRFVEVPARRHGVWPIPSRRSAAAAFGLAAALLVSFGMAGHFTTGFPSRVPPDVAQMASPVNDHNPRNDCMIMTSPSKMDGYTCEYGRTGDPSVLMLGDSHAHALSSELGNRLSRLGYNLIERTHDGCPPVYSWRRYSVSDFSDCGRFHAQAMDFLKSSPNTDTVIIWSRWPVGFEFSMFDNHEGGREELQPFRVALDDLVVDGGFSYGSADARAYEKVKELTRQSVEEILSLGKRVILVYPQPEAGWNVPTYLSKAMMFGTEIHRPLSTSYDRFIERSKRSYAALDAIGENRNLLRVYPENIFCNRLIKDRCAVEDGAVPYYFDDDHISSVGASLLSDEILAAMRRQGWLAAGALGSSKDEDP